MGVLRRHLLPSGLQQPGQLGLLPCRQLLQILQRLVRRGRRAPAVQCTAAVWQHGSCKADDLRAAQTLCRFWQCMPAGYASNPQLGTSAGTEAGGATVAAAATIINIDTVDPAEPASVYMAAEATTAILAANVDDSPTAEQSTQGSGDITLGSAPAPRSGSPVQVTLTQTLMGIQPQHIDLEAAAAAMQQTLQMEGVLATVTASATVIHPSGRRLRQDRGGSILVYLITSADGSSQRQAVQSDDLLVAEAVTAELLQRRVAAVASSPEAVQRVLEQLVPADLLAYVSVAEVAASSVVVAG